MFFRPIAFGMTIVAASAGLCPTVDILWTWHSSGARSLDDAKSVEVTMGALAEGGSMAGYPLMLNRLLGTKFKIVRGYEGATRWTLPSSAAKLGDGEVIPGRR